MIIDKLDQLGRYAVPKFQSIQKFIAEHRCADLPDGEIEIEGRELFVRVMSYIPKETDENPFEIHLKYADLQYVLQGAEIMQTSRLEDLTPLKDYDPKGDYQFFQPAGAINAFVVHCDQFAVFYPQEPHRPSCKYESYKGMVKKLVFKIKMAG